MLADIDHIHPPAYIRWHKCWVQPTGFTEGPNEVRMLMEKLDGMIISESTNKKVKRTFKEKPLICDCLPKSVPAQYMCKKRTENHSQPARCAQFNHPIVMVKKITDEETGNTYQKVHVTF
eukprot:3574649-Ditylum_brightwellii.AAC.1